MTEGAFMTKKDMDRLKIMIRVEQRKLSQTQASRELGLSLRQTQRIYKNYQNKGPISLLSKKRGKPGNRQLDQMLKARVRELVTIDQYQGFGPTFMTEILLRDHKINISRETVRQLMIKEEIWKTKKQKCPVLHQQRQRRARRGELVQTDGSPHAWFEERGEKCTLIVCIDDATGQTYGKFFRVETTIAYMQTLKEYIKKYGRPQAIYSDKHSIFRINKPGCVKKENLTQLGRALKELSINLYWANSPQAKGRVERANQTLQDRLVKELRLQKIQDIETANKYLEERFWEEYNKKFEVEAKDKTDAHREKPTEQEIDKILSEKYERKVSKNMEIQFENIIYQIKEKTKGIIRTDVQVIKDMKGKITIKKGEKELKYQEYGKQEEEGKGIDSKQILFAVSKEDSFLKEHKKTKPTKYHPWNKEAQAIEAIKEYARR